MIHGATQKRLGLLMQKVHLPGHTMQYGALSSGIYVALYEPPVEGRSKLKHAIYEGREEVTL